MVSTAPRNALGIRQFPRYPSLCFKSRLRANHFRCENDFLILMQIKLIRRKVFGGCLVLKVIFFGTLEWPISKTAIKKINLN